MEYRVLRTILLLVTSTAYPVVSVRIIELKLGKRGTDYRQQDRLEETAEV